MISKNISRLRRAQATRRRIARLRVVRLSVHRTNQHIYASIISAEGDRVLASASTVEAEVRGQLSGHGGNLAAAVAVGCPYCREGQGGRHRHRRFRPFGFSLSWARQGAR